MNQMDPWLPDLTKSQKMKTIKLAASIARDRPSSHDISLAAEVDLDLKSISQCKVMLGFMRKCLWDACGGDGSVVSSVMQGVMNSALGNDQSPIPATKFKSKIDSHLKDGSSSNIAAGAGAGAGARSDKSDLKRGDDDSHFASYYKSDDTYQSPNKDKSLGDVSNMQLKSGDRSKKAGNQIENEYDAYSGGGGDSKISTINDNETINEESTYGGNASASASVITFETFSAGEGKVYHDSFMDTKEALKANKARQKEIIQILNRQKIIIDNCTDILQRKEQYDNNPDNNSGEGVDLGEYSSSSSSSSSVPPIRVSEMSGEYISEIRMQYDSSKKDYRAAHNELQICKKQVGELEVLKQRALAVLLKEFDEFSKKIAKVQVPADNI